METLHRLLLDQLPPKISHPHAEIVDKLAQLNMGPDELEVLAQHIRACGHCRAALRDARTATRCAA